MQAYVLTRIFECLKWVKYFKSTKVLHMLLGNAKKRSVIPRNFASRFQVLLLKV